jgi:ketosteroid isomerase-like protein
MPETFSVSQLRVISSGAHIRNIERYLQLRDRVIAANLAAVEANFHSAATNEVQKTLEPFTDDIVWESPVRNLVFRGKEATSENYRKMFASFQVESFKNLQHFTTENRVVDDSVVRVILVGDGVENAPVPVGSEVEIRFLHIFEIRDGKISRVLVFENWQLTQPHPSQISYKVSRSLSLPHAMYS